MNRRKFIIFSFLLPVSINVSAFGQFFIRSIIRYAFRVLTRRVFSRYSSRSIGRSIARTSYRAYKPSRIKKTFGNQKYNIKGKNGRVIGTSKIEGEVMVLRGSKNHILGYLQSENKGLAVYDGNGTRVILFKKKNNKIIAYNNEGDYLGQLIEDMVKDHIKSYFIDKQGNKYDSIPIEFKKKSDSIAMTSKNTRIIGGRLEVFNEQNSIVLYGIHKDGDIVMYNLENNIVATIKKNDGLLSIYDNSGKKMGSSNLVSELISIEY